MMPGPLTRQLLSLRSRLMSTPTFWRTRQQLQRASFEIAKARSLTHQATRSALKTLDVAWTLIKATALTALIAVATAEALQFIDLVIGPAGAINPNTYDQLLQAAAGVTGLLLALSFAAISTLASAMFTRLPSNLRHLFLEMRVTKLSINSLAFITVLCTTALGLRTLGLPPSRLTTIALLLALPSVIVSMTLVARRILDLFDPSSLALEPLQQLLSSAVAAQIGEHRATDPSFQDYQRRRAQEALETLATMVAFAQREEQLRGDSLLRLTNQILRIIPAYLEAKRLIPSTSRWFVQRPRFPAWYRAGSTQLDMATMTESSLRPTLEADHHWVERRILDLTANAYQTMLDDPNSGRPQQLLLQANTTLRSLGEEWDLGIAKEYAGNLLRVTTTSFAHARPTLEAEAAARENITDAACALPIAAFLGFATSAAELDLAALAQKIQNLPWESSSGIAALRPRLAQRKLLEQIQRTVIFERDTEGRMITPGRTHATVSLHELNTELRAALGDAVRSFATGTPATAMTLHAIDVRLGAIACVSGLVFRWLVERHLAHLREVPEMIAQVTAQPNPAPWPWEEWQTTVGQTRASIEVELAGMLQNLARPPEPHRRDLFGEGVHRIGEGSFDALLRNQGDRFAQLFPAYFEGILLTIDHLGALGTGAEELGVLVPDAMLDLIHLSGYARIGAALHTNRQLWAACRNSWEQYLADDNAPQNCQAITLMIERGRLRITPRSTHRTAWQTKMVQTLRRLPQEERQRRGAMVADRVPRHPSRLIQFLGRNGARDYHYDGGIIFRDTYLRRHPACASVRFQREDLVSQIRRFVRLRYG